MNIINFIIKNFGNINLYGFTNLIQNPIALLLLIVAIVYLIKFIKKKSMYLMYLFLTFFALGYGTVIFDGARRLIDVLSQIVR